jgi:hypothetical protein
MTMSKKGKSGARPPNTNNTQRTNSSGEPDLLPGETISFADDMVKAKATDEELNSRYVKGDVRIVTESARYPLSGILAMLQEELDVNGHKEERYKLDPEYQRRHRWGVQRQSRLIESFLMNVPVPPVFLYERDLAKYEVMDGRQRLTALRDFYADEFPLTGLQYWPDLDGRRYSNLPSKIRDGIDRRYVSSIILLKETAANEEQAATLKKMVFERLNSGGVELSGQETRNAVYNGPLNRLCLELSGNPTFKKMWGLPSEIAPESNVDEDSDDGDGADSTQAGRRMFEKMEDVELVLRFFAYRQLKSVPGGLNRISAFLDQFLIRGNRFSSTVLEGYRELFENTISLLWELLGVDAFRAQAQTRKQPTKIVYDPLMYVASRYHKGDDRSSLLSKPEILRQELKKMYDEHRDLFSGRRTNSADVGQRNTYMANAFDAALKQIRERA